MLFNLLNCFPAPFCAKSLETELLLRLFVSQVKGLLQQQGADGRVQYLTQPLPALTVVLNRRIERKLVEYLVAKQHCPRAVRVRLPLWIEQIGREQVLRLLVLDEKLGSSLDRLAGAIHTYHAHECK